MLKKILAQFEKTQQELESFITNESKIKEQVENNIAFLNASVAVYEKDIAKAARVKKKLAKLIG